MRTIIVALVCLGVGFGAALVFMPTSAPESEATSTGDAQQYTCGMHPDILSDEPGICPICNMNLTPKRDAGTDAGTIRIDPTTRQNMGLVTTPVSHLNLATTVSTFGEVSVPDPNVHRVTLKFEGWVERLFVSEEGEELFRGQPLLEIYSPKLVAAQKELLVALKSQSTPSMQALVEGARRRLENWDISEDQINQLEESGEIQRTLIIRSPSDGFVKSKKVVEGDRVSAKTVLYEIIDLSEVWIEARVEELDLAHISMMQSATAVIPSLSGEAFPAAVSFISPQLDRQGYAEVRLAIANPDFRLKPAMYAEVTFEQASARERLAIPRAAVINSGVRQVVFVAVEEDSYEPRTVVTGAVGENDMIEVIEGLGEGELVVVSGQFLLDSESRLSESMTSGHDHHAMTSGNPVDPYDIHTCPMPSHYHVLNYGPGQCPDCNMDLVPIAETDHAPVYVCPMPECGTVSGESGTCPVCNMFLIEYETDEQTDEKTESTGPQSPAEHFGHDEHSATEDDPYDIHTCPMPSHYHVLNYGPGQCSDCNMDLVPVSETDNAPIYVCPMPRCGPAMKEPGVCSHCNMVLVEYQPGGSDD